MDAIVIAGGIPRPEDPLYTYSHGDSKALIDVAGKPMLQWVLDALGGAKRVDNVILVGLSAKSSLTCKKPLYYVSNQGKMLANIITGINKALELNKKAQYVLVVSSDIPALKPEMVDWLVDTCMETEDDLYYGICPKDVMEARFPGSKRTFTKLKDIQLCSADIHMAHVSQATEHLDLWESLMGSRKSPLKQASMIGLDTFFQVFTHSITLDDLVAKVCGRIGVKGRVIVWPQAEPCMDVDKPHQLELLREDLERQQRKALAKAKSAEKKPVKRTTKPKPAAKTAKRAASDGKKHEPIATRSKLKAEKKI
ncbi:MAG TPA: NTP transferase domain-containing protein [Anaerolineales bacterium]|nr:NTP transferase domain-containing protein [Anaerolineales bacterium]